MSNPSVKNQWPAAIAMGIVAAITYLIMRKYVLSDKIESQDYIIAGALAVGLSIGQFFMAKKKK